MPGCAVHCCLGRGRPSHEAPFRGDPPAGGERPEITSPPPFPVCSREQSHPLAKKRDVGRLHRASPENIVPSLSGSDGHEGGAKGGGGKRGGRRRARVHPEYDTVVKESDVGVFIGASHKVRAGSEGALLVHPLLVLSSLFW